MQRVEVITEPSGDPGYHIMSFQKRDGTLVSVREMADEPIGGPIGTLIEKIRRSLIWRPVDTRSIQELDDGTQIPNGGLEEAETRFVIDQPDESAPVKLRIPSYLVEDTTSIEAEALKRYKTKFRTEVRAISAA